MVPMILFERKFSFHLSTSVMPSYPSLQSPLSVEEGELSVTGRQVISSIWTRPLAEWCRGKLSPVRQEPNTAV